MTGYYISCDRKYSSFFEEIIQKIEEIKGDLKCYITLKKINDRQYAEIISEMSELKNIKIFMKSILRDIILINYKYMFFKKSLSINITDKSLESLFFTSITLYDRDYDCDILSLDDILENELSIDGVFRFCLRDLHLRWINVAQILQENFYNDSDKEAIYEFVKHIIYSIPCKINELNIYKSKDNGYKFTDKNGRNLADFISYNGGELASKIIFLGPALINFCDKCDKQTKIFLKNIFNDRIKFY